MNPEFHRRIKLKDEGASNVYVPRDYRDLRGIACSGSIKICNTGDSLQFTTLVSEGLAVVTPVQERVT